MPTSTALRQRFDGAIAGIGTTSGTRIVIGMWPRSPLGSFADVMLERPDGHRVLLAPNQDVVEFVSATYNFDETVLCDVTRGREGNHWWVKAGALRVEFEVGKRTALGGLLRLVPEKIATQTWFTAAIDPIARVVMRGVRTKGTAGAGRTEYYSALDQHKIVAAQASWEGAQLGTLTPVEPPVSFGFGSTPSAPSLVRIITTITQREG